MLASALSLSYARMSLKEILERGREGRKSGGRERERERERVCVCAIISPFYVEKEMETNKK